MFAFKTRSSNFVRTCRYLPHHQCLHLGCVVVLAKSALPSSGTQNVANTLKNFWGVSDEPALGNVRHFVFPTPPQIRIRRHQQPR
jgi:hypothetical protein